MTAAENDITPQNGEFAPANQALASTPKDNEIHSGVGVLDKTVKILDALESGPSTLGQLVSATGLARPTAHRLAIALERHRFVLRDQHGRFVLGSRFAELAAAAGEDRLLTAAGPILQTLLDRTGESAQIYRRQGDQRVCIAAVERASGLRDSIPVGAMLSMEAGSAAQILLAWEDSDRLHQGLRHAKFNAAKLAQVLHTRWAAGKPGVIVLACELIDHNGEELLRIMNQYVSDWGWEDEFSQWMANDCTVCTTLVDTIVPGRIRDPKEAAAVAERLGYEDPFLAVREPFQMWGIQGDESLAEKLPFVKAGLPGVFVTPDVTPYKKRKVRILNGAHTAFVPGSWVAGFDIVRDCMHDETVRGFMNTMLYHEVIPTLAADLDVEDCKAFAAAVENRFDNPFIDHALLSICLNSTAKWRARDLPTLKDYVAETGSLPKCLATSLATLIAFYTQELVSREGDGLHLRRADGTEYTAQDDAFVLDFYAAHAGADDAELVHDVLTNEQMWGEDLTQIAGLEEFVVNALTVVRAEGVKQAFANAQA